jgi:hypothetical protein
MLWFDDMVMLSLYYLPSLLFAIAASVMMLVILLVAKSLRQKWDRWTAWIWCLLPVPVICWCFYVTFTVQFASTLILLDSESAQTAENAYDYRFKSQVKTLDGAVRLAVNTQQSPSVRFYASCLVADLLATNNDVAVSNVLRRVEKAPVIDTDFFGGNRLTRDFYIPGRAQAHLYPSEIIEQRLENLRQSKQQ